MQKGARKSAPSVSLSIEDQHEIGKKIEAILSKEIGHYFHLTFQGAGKAHVAKLNVSKGNEKFMKEAKRIISSDLGINIEEITGHGRGANTYTVLIKLSEVSLVSKEKIKGKINSYHHEEPVVEVSQKTEKKFFEPRVYEPEIIPSKNLKLSFIRSLRGIFNLEGIEYSAYQMKFIEKDHTVDITSTCEIIDMIEEIVSFKNGTMLRDDFSITVDYSSLSSDNFLFAFPPKKGESIEIFTKKIKRIYPSRVYPKVEKNDNGFLVSFLKRNSFEKIQEILFEIGWNFDIFPNKTIFVPFSDYEVSVQSKTVEEESIIPFSDSQISNGEDLINLEVNDEVGDIIENNSQSSSMKDFVTKSEIIKELETMLIFADGSLSLDTKKKIYDKIRSNMREENPEEYANFLLELVDSL
jgi:hypothetical protein